MKTKNLAILLLTGIAILFFSSSLFAIDYSARCAATDSIITPDLRDFEIVPVIEDAFANYTTYYNSTDGVYYLNFSSAAALVVAVDFIITINSAETRNIYICNMNIQRDGPTVTPLLTITNSSNKSVHLYNSTMTNVKNGLKIIKSGGSGGFSVNNMNITGDSSKLGSCLTANVAGAVITGGEFKNCSNGIKVGANNVHISDADIHANKYGVYIDAVITGTDVENTLIYANESGLNASDRRQDGIFFADEPRDLVFYDVVDGAAVNLSDTSSVAFNYGSRTPYIS